jgi:hypothetical protein
MLYITESSPSERGNVAGLQTNVPLILRSRVNLCIYVCIYIYIYIYTHTLLLTVDFAVDLGSGLR